MAQANVKLTVDATQATRALQGVQNKTTQLNGGLNRIKTAIAGIGLTVLARQAVKTSTSFEKLNVRLKLLSKSSSDFAKSQKIAAEAQKAFGLSATEALEGVTDITARLAPLGTSVEDIKTVFFGFNTAAKLAGASAVESSNAFRQLAQALGSGRLAGDEFRSISEQVPTVLAPIAEELGVTIGQLKKLAADGALTSDVVLRALGRIGREGSGFLKELLANDPTQVFKNLSNETENLSRAFGDLLKPAVLEGTRQLTRFVEATTNFVNSDAGKASFVIAGIALAAKGIAVFLPLAGAAVAAVNLKIIALTSSLMGLKIALAGTGIGLLVIALGGLGTAFFKARREAKAFQDLIKEGGEEDVTKALEEQKKAVEELEKALQKSRGNAQRGAQRKLEEAQADLDALQTRLNTLEVEKQITEEKQKQNEASKKIQEEQKKQEEQTKTLKEKYMEIGKSIEDGVVQNLTDAAMGAQTLGQAAINVLNDLKRKLIEVAIQQAVTGLGNFLGNALVGLFTGGGGKNFSRSAARQTPTLTPQQQVSRFTFGGSRRANGGPVSAGGAYLVGERGPELLQMGSRGGNIIPNNAIGGGGTTNNMITVNVDASGTSVQGNGSEADQLGQLIGGIVQATLVEESRAGGLLNR